MVSSTFQFLLVCVIVLYISGYILFLYNKSGISVAVVTLGFLVQTYYQIQIGFIGDIFIFLKVVESPGFLPWIFTLLALFTRIKSGVESTWAHLLVPAVIFSIITVLTPLQMTYFGPNKLTIWAILYFIFDFSGQACFISGALMAFLFLIKKDNSFEYNSFLIWGFIFHTIAQITGAVWCFLGWATTFQWVYVHLQSAAIWMYYANYLHLKFLSSWQQRRIAVYALAGAFLILLFKYL